jgi:hypothetical protein
VTTILLPLICAFEGKRTMKAMTNRNKNLFIINDLF